MCGEGPAVLQNSQGHTDIQVAMRYARLSSKFSREEVRRVNDPTHVKLVPNSGSASIESLANVLYYRRAMLESNRRHQAPGACALSAELLALI